MKNIQGNQINFRQDPVQTAHINLVVAIIEQAIKEEGTDYLNSVDGKYWMDIIGVDSKRILKLVDKPIDKS